MPKNYLSLIIIFFSFQYVAGQYDFKIPGNEINEKCRRCQDVFARKPKEVKFGVKRDKQNNLYFEINNREWFDKFFKNEGDGIAVDVVIKNRYDCAIPEIKDEYIKGDMLKPVYKSALKKGLKKVAETSMFRVRIGKLSQKYIDKDVEFNIMFFNDKYLCRYNVVYNLESYPWALLDTGMYLDSLTYKSSFTKSESEKFITKSKTLKFIVPFKKNKATYSQEDIKPLYDSLRLTNFNIKKININAYSSVEGNLDRNIKLQTDRANSIISALQKFQKPTIITKVTTSENWVEFFNDIAAGQYSHLKELNKTAIKQKLKGNILNDLEKYLKNHRKAVVELDLERKDKYKNMSPDQLLGLFNESVAAQKISDANEIQNSIFDKLKDKVINPDFLSKMRVPKQVKFLPILSKNAIIKFMVDQRYMLIAYNELKDLEKTSPRDFKIKYNLASLKLHLWKNRAQPVDERVLKREILNLKNYGVAQNLIERLIINFHIVKSDVYYRKGDYNTKDFSVDYINKTYKNIVNSDNDYLSLAQYLSYYANTDKSVALLKNKVKSIDVDEDLLFYYLNLTLIDKTLTVKSEYRTIMLNAININKSRFCRLFNSVENGGVTFQLLEDKYLRKTYCESCNLE